MAKVHSILEGRPLPVLPFIRASDMRPLALLHATSSASGRPPGPRVSSLAGPVSRSQENAWVPSQDFAKTAKQCICPLAPKTGQIQCIWQVSTAKIYNTTL